ncbi:MAG TPA: porphobilinogen synthase [Candidatus Polarisedimenticolia bacterium]|nr:porphobilinogen synthase [Candidatus Polarisedimenticolia bacterium]
MSSSSRTTRTSELTGFPSSRPRRLRRTGALRRLVQEAAPSGARLILPIFVVPGSGVKQEIGSLPGVFHHSVDTLVAEASAAHDAGVAGVILFGIPESKDSSGSGAWAEDGIAQRAMRALREKVPGLLRVADVCLCEYTDHGHCGLLDASGADVLNDRTLELLGRTAVSLVQSGADLIAPSDMMDGRVAAIRAALDGAGFTQVPIMSYAAKYASVFYGPFRDAAGSAPRLGDRRGYQMDPANAREAMREMQLDVEEGADILMVKPAMPYLDIIRMARDRFDLPIAAFQVSGEYAMIQAAAQRGMLDRERAIVESITSIHRAGADIILTYFAREAMRLA